MYSHTRPPPFGGQMTHCNDQSNWHYVGVYTPKRYRQL